MLTTTPEANKRFLQAITSLFATIHLYTDTGAELTGHGYESKAIDPNKWEGGNYPDITWEFKADSPATVVGYFLRDAKGQLLATERMDDTVIERTGDRITVRIRLGMVSGAA